jgi:hypothetical protein
MPRRAAPARTNAPEERTAPTHQGYQNRRARKPEPASQDQNRRARAEVTDKWHLQSYTKPYINKSYSSLIHIQKAPSHMTLSTHPHHY